MGNLDGRKYYFFKMEYTSWLSLLIVLTSLATPARTQTSSPRVVCYYTNWSVYRAGTARFNPQNINPYLCTHLVYAFGAFTKENTLKPFDKYQDIEKGGYAKFTGLKTYNKELKTLLAIGGWNEGSSRFSPMVAEKSRRKEFVKNAIKFLRQNHFDGLDLDWEYPAFRDGGKPKDRDNYAKLVKELREEFEKESQKTGKSRLLLTMAVPAGIEYIQKGYDVKTLNRYLDWMNLLTYDYHSAFEPAVNHHAPLFPLEEPNEYSVDNELNIDYTIKFYLENGADRDKLVLGIPTYGRSYTLFNPDAVEIGSPADGPGEQGDATKEKGYLAYYEICEALKPKRRRRATESEEEDDEVEEEEESAEEEKSEEENLQWSVVHPNPNAMGPVAYRGNQWVGFDDINIVRKKAEYVAENGLGGIMFWSIDNDDFRGSCHDKPYPLIEAAKESYILKRESTRDRVITEAPVLSNAERRRKNRPRSSSTTSTTVTTTTTTTPKPAKSNKRKSSASSSTPAWNLITPEPPTTPDPGSDFKCKDEGFFPHPRDCKKYFWCLDSGPSDLGIVAHQFTCPSGLYFNKAADSCDFARNVLCKVSASTTKAPTKATSKPTPSTTPTTTTTTTTTRIPFRISTRNSLLFRSTTTTSTTPEPEVSDEVEEQPAADDISDVEAEDPKVIKELIDLIKKVGGIEQLEKQLKLSETSVSTDGVITTTPSALTKKLYQKVLERARGKNKYSSDTLLENVVQNSRGGPQNAGLEPAPDKDRVLRKDRPQYVTINRARSSTTPDEPQNDEEDEESEEDQLDIVPQRSRSIAAESEAIVGTTAKSLQYVNIRRPKPTSASTTDVVQNSDSRNALFERSEPFVAVENSNAIDITNSKRESIPEYVTLRRSRPTTTETTTSAYVESELDDSRETALEREISSQVSEPQYTNIVRARSTTFTPLEEPQTPEPTTVLSVQISSLLNTETSPVKETQRSETNVPQVNEKTEPTAAFTTTPLSTTTSTTTITYPPNTSTRRSLLRRRGSTSPPTSSTTETSVSSTQVSSRDYSFIRRRRPLSQSNEISLVKVDSVENLRKVRSTTPGSREVEGFKADRNRVPSRKFKIRLPGVLSDDSATAAASQIASLELDQKNHEYKSKEDDDSLTNMDDSSFYEAANNDRYVGVKNTAMLNKEEDSEVSAATVEERKPVAFPRGRGKFSTFTTKSISVSTETPIISTKRPTFVRFTPRPFTRASFSVNSETNNNIQQTNQKTSLREPFNRQTGTTNIGNGIQGRRLPFTSRLSTTPRVVLSEDDEEIDSKYDDISLSESAIEEKEHGLLEDKSEATIKEFSSGKLLTDNSFIEETTTESNERRKFKIIRRRPTTSASIIDALKISTEPNIPRIRKIIRKKLKSTEDESDSTTLVLENRNIEVTSKSSLNYGEKTKTTTPIPTTLFISNTEKEYNDEDIEIITEILKETTTPFTPPKDTSIFSTISSNVKEEVDKIFQSDDELNSEEQDVLTTTLRGDEINSGVSMDILVQTEDKVLDISEIKTSTENNNIAVEQKKVLIESHFENDTLTNTKEEQEKYRDKYENEGKDESTTITNSISKPNQELSYDGHITIMLPENNTETTTTSTTHLTSPSPRSRSPYKPPKSLFTSTTEAIPSSSRIFSRKYNPGAYTSPATVERPGTFGRPTTKKTLFARTFTRRTFPTPKTTPKYKEEEEIEYSDEEILEEEPEEDVYVPPTKLLSQSGSEQYEDNAEDEEEAVEDVGETAPGEFPEDEILEEPAKFSSTSTSKKPLFKPRVINSNTFRTSSTTTELPKPGNKTITNNRFSSNKLISDTKKRVQNVPVGYSAPKPPSTTEFNKSNIEKITTVNIMDDIIYSTESFKNLSNDSISEDNSSFYTKNRDVILNKNETNDYLASVSITSPSISETLNNFNTNLDAESVTTTEIVTETMTDKFNQQVDETTEVVVDTTYSPYVPPIVKTQFNKLFSVSRVVEVSSKSEKHRLNKNNETTLIEQGEIIVERKPTIDKIGEVSRYSLIKIVEDEIPIYLTKLGHVYPVDNPPDNPIRIDEARNARALKEFSDAPNENLVASESMNEAYRHVNRVSNKTNEENIAKVEHILNDDFLLYVNDDKKIEKLENSTEPSLWQFVPAAFENEQNKQITTVSDSEPVTPRIMSTGTYTLPLESLFNMKIPGVTKKNSGEGSTAPFVVYSAPAATIKDDLNFVKLKFLKPQNSTSIITFAKGKEFKGSSIPDNRSTISISVLMQETTPIPFSSPSTISRKATGNINVGPILEMLANTTNAVKNDTVVTTMAPTESSPSTVNYTNVTTLLTTESSLTTETILGESTTEKISSVDAKRLKYGLPRRPIIKPSNTTRYVLSSRTNKKINNANIGNINKSDGNINKSGGNIIKSGGNIIKSGGNINKPSGNLKINKTSSFSPNNQRQPTRTQNVPVDIKKRIILNKPKAFTRTTDSPKSTTEKKISVKPLRPSFRPAFIPRRTTIPTTEGDT